MTLGQRIAQKRKEQGLSQEALGEALGVSRQAIYKWESGAALPEIEKLVALSRCFSVSVGWLLGVEEQAADPEAAPENGGELTETQLQMVEEIVRRYQAAQPTPLKRKKWPFVLATLVLIVAFVRLFSMLGNLENDYQQMQNAVSMIDRNVDARIGSITYQVESILSRVNSFTLEHSAEITAVDLETNTISFALRAAPKTYTQGMAAVFQADWGGGIEEAEAVIDENKVFSATLSCPLTDDIQIKVAFLVGDKQETQTIQSFVNLYTASFPVQYISSIPIPFHQDADVFHAGHLHLHISSNDNPDIPQAEITEMRFGLFEDQKLVYWFEPLDEQPDSYLGEWEDYLFFSNPRDFTLNRECVYCLAVVVTDSFGRERIFTEIPAEFSPDESEENGGYWRWADAVDLSPDPAGWDY